MGGFVGVVAADRNEGAAQADDTAKRVPQPGLPEGVGEVDLRLRLRVLARRAARRAQAALPDQPGDRVGALRMPRHEDKQQIGTGAQQIPVRGQRHLVLPRMSRAGEPEGSARDQAAEPIELGGVEGQRAAERLEVDACAGPGGAELRQKRGGPLVLAVDQAELVEQMPRRGGQPPPSARRTRRDAGVHERQRNAGIRSHADQLRPQLALDQRRRVRAPMRQKALEDPARVERRKLVQGARGQAVGDDPRRGRRARGDQEGALRMHFRKPFDQPQHRQAFADGGGVEPRQRPGRSRRGGVSGALAHAFGIDSLRRQIRGHAPEGQRRGDVGRRSVDQQRKRGHRRQPPVWLMWRATFPPTIWRE